MVSTDDQEIAQTAKEHGAEVPFLRSSNTSGDYAATVEVLLEVLTNYEKLGKYFTDACCIYPTAPFITAEKLENAMKLLDDPDTEAVVPVTAFSFPPLRGMYIREEKLFYHHPEYVNVRSQDIETMYHDCGQFYCFKPQILKCKKKLITEHTKAVIVPESEVQDIDTLQDWVIAEMKYQCMLSKQQKQ